MLHDMTEAEGEVNAALSANNPVHVDRAARLL